MGVLNWAAAAGLTALIGYLLIVGNPILPPLVIAVFVWYLINALAAAGRGITFRGRRLPANVRFGAALVALVGLAWVVVALIIGNVNQVVAAAPVYEQNLQRLLTTLSDMMGLEDALSPRGVFGGIDFASMVRRLAFSLTGIVGSIGTITIYVVFLLLEQHSFSRKITSLFPDPQREALVHRILQRIGDEIQTYVWLKTVTSLMTGVASYLVMKMVGVNFAEFWALLIFALNYIPYIGALLGVVFPTVLTLVQYETFGPFVVTALTLTVIQFSIGSILEPRLMGKGLNLSPLIMLVALTVWGTIWGVVGMFLAVPLMVVVMIVCSHFAATRPLAIIMSADGELRA